MKFYSRNSSKAVGAGLFFAALFCACSPLHAAPEPAYVQMEKTAVKVSAGAYPEWFRKKETQAIIIGYPENKLESSLALNGTLQPLEKTFTVTPFLIQDRKVHTSSDFKLTRDFLEGYLPIPRVVWTSSKVRLSIRAAVARTGGKKALYVRYQVTNPDQVPWEGKLALAVRPFRQHCYSSNHLCFTKMEELHFSEEGKVLLINKEKQIFFSQLPEAAGMTAFQKQDITPFILEQKIPQMLTAQDPSGLASGVFVFPYSLKPGEKTSFSIAIPLEKGFEPKAEDFLTAVKESSVFWRNELNKIQIEIHPKSLQNLWRREFAALLVRRAGPAAYPAPDGSLWSGDAVRDALALVQYGSWKYAREDFNEIAKWIDASGEVSAQLNDAALNIHEYQSQGKTVFGLVRAARIWNDQKWLKEKMPVIEKILEYLVRLRQERLTYFYDTSDLDRRRYFGLLPPSMDHASKKPESRHRYLDVLWALRGWKDGQRACIFTSANEKIQWMKMEEEGLRRSLLDSIDLLVEKEKIKFIPAYPDSPEYEPQMGGMIYWPLGEAQYLPPQLTRGHLDLHYQRFSEALAKKDTARALRYSGYDAVQSFLRAGYSEEAPAIRRKQAFEMLRFHLAHLPESLPRGNVSLLKFLRSAFVYEHEGKLILGSGILPEWISPKTGLYVRLPTESGEIRYSIHQTATGYAVKAEGDARPREGFLFYGPEGFPVKRFTELPASFEIKGK